jgi:hypothetical protein
MSDLLGLIDSLARVQLAAKRAGCVVCGVHGAPAGLGELVELVGLTDVLVVEPGGKAVEREERVGVEEERALDDTSA